jgi:hypothetical protein
MKQINNKAQRGWLLVFYSIPSRDVRNRVKIWRKLAKAGAVNLKGSVSILPMSDDTYEFCQWLVSEVKAMKGEATFVKAERIETMIDSEVADLFILQRAKDYHAIGKKLGDIAQKVSSIKKGSESQSIKSVSRSLHALEREFEEVRKIDFFSSDDAEALEKKFKELESDMKKYSVAAVKHKSVIVPRDIKEYQGKVWVTRKRPFVDRMASAWLIKRFIDPRAIFSFVDEQEAKLPEGDAVTFDMRNAALTHIADMCTFEVILKSFGLKTEPLMKIASIVHELDLKDEKKKNAESRGIEEILKGIRKTAGSDEEAIEKGMAVFEMLYASKT